MIETVAPRPGGPQGAGGYIYIHISMTPGAEHICPLQSSKAAIPDFRLIYLAIYAYIWLYMLVYMIIYSCILYFRCLDLYCGCLDLYLGV